MDVVESLQCVGTHRGNTPCQAIGIAIRGTVGAGLGLGLSLGRRLGRQVGSTYLFPHPPVPLRGFQVGHLSLGSLFQGRDAIGEALLIVLPKKGATTTF